MFLLSSFSFSLSLILEVQCLLFIFYLVIMLWSIGPLDLIKRKLNSVLLTLWQQFVEGALFQHYDASAHKGQVHKEIVFSVWCGRTWQSKALTSTLLPLGWIGMTTALSPNIRADLTLVDEWEQIPAARCQILVESLKPEEWGLL